ncbi:response regulator [Allorhizobium pseudoryzae]|uniref:response regulator n=1 Tax=Allorhizobium pseudoryzae TaxID=379684 RepID=UPI003D0628E3
MGEGLPLGEFTETHLLDIISETISGAVLLYDRNDTIVFASAQLRNFLPALPVIPARGTRLRDIFGVIFDNGGYAPKSSTATDHRHPASREDWVAGEIASLWKERAETLVHRGGDRWMSLAKRRLPSGFGICIFRDVSDVRKREEQWRADLERVQVTEEILDHLPFPVIVKDRKLTYVAINQAACSLYDLAPEAILGHNTIDLHVEDFALRVDEADRKVLETGVPSQIAENVTRPDGSAGILITRKFRIGKPGRYLVVTAMEDLSDAVEAGFEPQRLFAGLEGLDFVHSDMRHVIKDPDRNAPKSRARDIAGCKVLLVTAMQATEETGVALLTDAGLDATAARSIDEMNAIVQIAEERDVRIDLIVVDGEMDVACLEAAQDTGIDCAIIEAFQLETELVKLVTRHLQKRDPSSPPADEEADWQIAQTASIDVLVAEDNPVNQVVFSQILEGFGYRYVIASDGEEAVRLWRELNPRLILMDITLPVLNGFEAASKIRETEEVAGRTPIIGVLSPAIEGDRDACWAAGMNDVVMKPLSPDALEEKFRQFMGEDFRKWRHSIGN